jgi:IS30 family transposase
MRVSHEAIYQSLYIQGRGALRRDLTTRLALRPSPSSAARAARRRGKSFLAQAIIISKRPESPFAVGPSEPACALNRS